MDWREAARKLVGALPAALSGEGSSLSLGWTMLLYRAREHDALELYRNVAIGSKVVVLQRHARRLLARNLRAAASAAAPG